MAEPDRLPAADSSPVRTSAIAAVLAIGIGIVLRVQGVPRFILEQDELYTIRESRELWDTALRPGITARPLYFLLQHGLSSVLPASVINLRLMPLLFGIAGLWLTWRLARHVLGSTGGTAAAVILAISPWHMYVSGMARYWSLLYLASIAFLYFLIRGLETDRLGYLLGALAALIVGAATHPTFLFPMPGAVLGASLIGAGGRVGWTWPTRRALVALWVPFALFVAAAYTALQLSGKGGAVQNWSGRGVEATLRLVPAILDWLTMTVAAAAVCGAVVLARLGQTASARRWGAMTILGVGSAVVLLVVAAGSTDVYADYALAGLPLLVVSAGGIVQWVADQGSKKYASWAGAVVIAIVVAGMLPASVSHALSGTRFDYRPAFGHIERNGPETPVVIWPKNVQERYAPELRAYDLLWMNSARLDSMLSFHEDLWVVTSVSRRGVVTNNGAMVSAWVTENCHLSSASELTRFDYRRYRVEAHRCTTGPTTRD